MAEKTSEEFMAQLGFGGTPSTPLTQEFDAGAIRRASYDAAIKAQGTGFWEAAGKRYQQGSLNSILTVMDRPEPSEEPLLLTDDYVNELTDGLTNERAIKTRI